MGTRMAPCYANIFMAELEENFLSGYPYKPLANYRYIDDIFIIWSHGITVDVESFGFDDDVVRIGTGASGYQ